MGIRRPDVCDLQYGQRVDQALRLAQQLFDRRLQQWGMLQKILPGLDGQRIDRPWHTLCAYPVGQPPAGGKAS